MVVPTSVKLLYGVTCLSTTNCFAVGRTGTSDYNGHGVVLHTTNGSTWTPMSLPGGSTALLAITCSPTRCTAVGTNSSEEAVVLTYS